MVKVFHLNFTSTYFLEVYRGPRGQNTKVYQSEWWVDEPTKTLEPFEITDQKLFLGNMNLPIELKMFSRNQFTMTNTEICYIETNFAQLLGCMKLGTTLKWKQSNKDV